MVEAEQQREERSGNAVRRGVEMENLLCWYFNQSAGDLGLSSNFEPMRKMLELGGPTCGKPICEIDDRRLAAAEAERHVLAALQEIGKELSDVLRVAYTEPDGEEHCALARDLAAFGDCARLVLTSPRARRAWRASQTARTLEDWLKRVSRRVVHETSPNLGRDRMLVIEIVSDAKLQLEMALHRFGVAHKSMRRR